MELLIDTHGNEKQKDAIRAWIDNSIDDIVYGGSKGSAKSYTGISCIFSDAFTYDGTHYFIARKQLNDLRKHTIPSIHEVFSHWGITRDYYKYNGQDNIFQLANGSKVLLIEARYLPSDPLYERFGSMQMTRGMIEEAGEFERNAKNNLMASVGRWKNDTYGINGKIIQTCNPSKNYLYTDYYLPAKKGALSKHKRFIQALPTDNKKLPDGYLDSLRRNLTDSQKERLLYGNWEFDDDPDLIITFEQLMECKNSQYHQGQNYGAADIARYGDDSSSFAHFKGNKITDREIEQHRKFDTVEIAKKIIDYNEKNVISYNNFGIDTVGLGAGTYDFLKHDGKHAIEIVSGEKATENYESYTFKNLRSQMWWQFRLDVLAKNILVDIEDEEALTDLTSVKYSIVGDKMIQVEAKEDIKRRLGRSPDKGDVIVYANAMRSGIINKRGTTEGMNDILDDLETGVF